jgi:hypothetical protein
MDGLATLTCGSCGQKNRTTDRFCNHCGLPLTAPRVAPPAIPAAPPAAQAPSSKCVVGHPIAPGAHFCAHGHPIALDSLHLTRGGLSASPTPMPPAPAPAYAPGAVVATPASPMGSFESHLAAAPRASAPMVAHVAPPLDAQAYESPTARAQRSNAVDPAPVVATAAAVAPVQAPAPAPAVVPAQTAPAPVPREQRVLRGFLVPLQGRPTQEYWALHGMAVTVGRANTGDNVDVAVLDSTTSSRHAAIHFDPARGIVYVEDLGSTNGTFVNDVPIGHNGRRELRDNDRVRFGGFSALLKLLPLL